jgi:methyltransferase
VVAGEIAVLPLAFGLPWYAVAFTILNGAVLALRIRAENRALAGAGR